MMLVLFVTIISIVLTRLPPKIIWLILDSVIQGSIM